MKHVQARLSSLWRSCVACSSLFVCGKDLRKSFQRRGGAVKIMERWWCDRKDLESHSAVPVKPI